MNTHPLSLALSTLFVSPSAAILLHIFVCFVVYQLGILYFVFCYEFIYVLSFIPPSSNLKETALKLCWVHLAVQCNGLTCCSPQTVHSIIAYWCSKQTVANICGDLLATHKLFCRVAYLCSVYIGSTKMCAVQWPIFVQYILEAPSSIILHWLINNLPVLKSINHKTLEGSERWDGNELVCRQLCSCSLASGHAVLQTPLSGWSGHWPVGLSNLRAWTRLHGKYLLILSQPNSASKWVGVWLDNG